MRCLLAVVGKPRNAALATAIRDYEERAARYWPLEVREVKEEPARGATAAVVMRKEGERLGAQIGSARVIACEAGGTAMTSEAFAAWLQKERESGRDLAFVIGGAFGLAHDLVKRAARRLSLAPWTLPHELARLVLVEQLYRAGSIVRGEPYHK
jgi:23S rRNA (pseudouridine1915-N3)-methyltransferase